MIIKSLIIASIIFNLIGLNGLADKFDRAVIRNEYDPVNAAIAADVGSSLPDILRYPQVNANTIKPAIYARNYILVDADSGKILLQQAARDEVPIASTTKIMTAIVALENYKLDDIITISPGAAYEIGATANFRVGERLTVLNVLKALLIKSANGAAYALAEHMSKASLSQDTPLGENSSFNSSDITANFNTSDDENTVSASPTVNPTEKARIAKFMAAMNSKAKSLGMINTDYHDPAGLDTSGYSSAFDLYVATKYALAKPVFAEIVKTDHDIIKNAEGTIFHDLVSSNRLVGEYKYPGALGVKTGYMPEAGHVLVSAAKRDGHTLIGVIISTYTDTASASADESKKLLDWGFNNTTW